MITSWKLWSALQNPPALNPIFRRTANVDYLFNLHLPRLKWLRPVVIVLALSLGLLLALTNPQFVLLFILVIPMSIFFVLLVVPLLLLIGSNLLGAFWASIVSTSILREHERGTYDLLCLLPDGILGANWAISSGCMHRGAYFDLLYLGVRTLALFGIIILATTLVITIGIAAGPPYAEGDADSFRAIKTVMDMVNIILGYYIHHVQSVVLSPLIGILTAIHVRSQVEARLFAPIVFLALQVVSYALIFLVAFKLLPTIYQSFFVWNSLAYLTLPFAQLVIFCAVREGILFFMLKLVKQALNVQTSEFNHLISLPQ